MIPEIILQQQLQNSMLNNFQYMRELFLCSNNKFITEPNIFVSVILCEVKVGIRFRKRTITRLNARRRYPLLSSMHLDDKMFLK